MKTSRNALSVCVAVVSILGGLAVGPVSATAPNRAPRCAQPTGAWVEASPEEVQVDAALLQDALDWATEHSSFSLAVVRRGCLIGRSRLDPVTATQPYDGWSMTKSVTSLLVGRAVTLGLLDIDEPIARLVPEASAQHGALTPRQLLTMTSGLHTNWARELSPMPDRVRDALSLPFDHDPGTTWQYGQSPVTLLAHVLERAVGRDLQEWAQVELFGHLGIAPGTWKWERDRAGNTEGWAHLHMRAEDFARLGELMLRDGRWNGARLISTGYLRQATTSTRANDAYGFLIWLNDGETYVLPDIAGPDEGEGPLIPAAPRDSLVMAGAGEQRTYVIPSRGMVIVRLGERGSREGDTRTSVWTGRAGELDHELVRRIMRAVRDVPYADPGPYAGSDLFLPPLDEGLLGDAQDVEQLLGGLGAGPAAPPGCNPAGCD